ncbi:MAG TPA: hypothetical protein DDZ81_08420 [Acetobacteraceae bacterium]|jgi:hypothetical protein|nr:hypothetical protein [Acetobacteraceae bacterium]
MDMLAIYAASKPWALRPNIVLVEGTSDEALFKRADELSINAGRVLLGDDICVVAAGRNDRGGTFGVVRELITLRSMVPVILDKKGRPAYRVIGLVDNDGAGRRIINDFIRLDRGAVELHDIIAVRPVTPKFAAFDPLGRQREYDLANLPYRTLDWEIEDALSPRLLNLFDHAYPGMITHRRRAGDKIHHELTTIGKTALHRLVRREAILEDLAQIVQIVRMIRSILGLQAPAA